MQPLPDGEMPSGGGAPSGGGPDSDSSEAGGAASGGTGNQAGVGISLGDLDEDQLAAFEELLAAATGTWKFQFGGHHLAIANTYTDGALADATPSFRGLEPFGEFEYEAETINVMAVKAEAFRAYNGPRSRWYRAAMNQGAGRIRLADEILEVTFAAAPAELADHIDAAYREKYAGSPYLAPMLASGPRTAAVEISPAT